MPTEAQIQAKLDQLVTVKFKTTPIQYFGYAPGPLDLYKQKSKVFTAPILLNGRAILNPTKEVLSVIGNEERYDVAFLFTRAEMLRKFPTKVEGQWMDVSGELEWYSRRFKIEQVRPTGQTSTTFHLMVVLAMNLPGGRDG